MKLNLQVAAFLLLTLGIDACSRSTSGKTNASDTAGATSSKSQNDSADQSASSGNTSQDNSAQKDPSIASTRGSDVILQLFNYPFKKITEEMSALSTIGYGQIHVSPPNLTIDTDQWWGRYQPVDYRVIAGPLGTEAEFKAMIKAAHDSGVKIIVDVVFNHTANITSPMPREMTDIAASQGPLFTAADYHPEACIKDYNNPTDVRLNRICGGPGDLGLPDLDQNSAHVLQVQQEYLKRLNAMGADGYRLDAVKHIDPSYFSKLLTPEIRKDKFIFGEIIADQSAYDRDLAPYLAADPMAFYDFPFRDTIQKAFAVGADLKTLVDSTLVSSKRALPAEKSVAFVMNHDIPNNEVFSAWILDPIDEQLAYAFLLGRADGVPYVFSDLGTKGGGGITSDRWDHAYANGNLAKMVAFHNIVRGEPQTVLAADSCVVILQRGTKGAMGINKCGEAKPITIGNALPAGSQLTNLVTAEKITVSATTTLQLNPRSFLLLTFQ